MYKEKTGRGQIGIMNRGKGAERGERKLEVSDN